MLKIRPTLRTRIYISMLAMIIISLVVIGITTIIYFNKQNASYHQNRLERKEKTIIASLSYFFKDTGRDADLTTVSRDFEEEISKLADINGVEVKIFSLQGQIIMSSNYDYDDPNFYEQKMDEKILLELLSTEERQVVETDESHVSTYSVLKGKDGNTPVAFVNIPYDKTDSPEAKGLVPFLTSLIEIYVFLLIGAALVAFFLSNYITRSLRTISDKLKDVQINKKNEPLQWSGSDEISSLVEEYNRMISQLDESASRLAKSERENAWREMAKQVAHEIKNPLTPMKLSVQHLERALKPDDPDFDEKLKMFSAKLVTQIDALTGIANEFSNFAKMPKSKMETLDVISLLNVSIELFKEHNDIQINFDRSNLFECNLQGDREQLTRVFNNIIKNAIQAMNDKKQGKIDIKISVSTSLCEITFTDNGKGIPEEVIDKIFVPNFTTKTSGSGLGLAMVKQIVEAHKGTISFTTKENEGTTFVLELPL
jgi:two-component system nitrogen regulation sensor histidine kinase NtrY